MLSECERRLSERWWRETHCRFDGPLESPGSSWCSIGDLSEDELAEDLSYLRLNAERLTRAAGRAFRPRRDSHGLPRDHRGAPWFDELFCDVEPLDWITATPLYQALSAELARREGDTSVL